MWWYILVLGCLQLCATSSAAGQHLPEWGLVYPRPQQTHPKQNFLNYRLRQYKPLDIPIKDSEQHNPKHNPEAETEAEAEAEDIAGKKDFYTPSSKRAFTLLSRWHPFSTLNRNVPSIREQNQQMLSDLDIETRAMMRPAGQPLRWG